MLPFGLIEQILRLVNLLLESTDPAQRRASLLLWWHRTWPLMQIGLKPEVVKQIEGIVAEAGKENG